MKLILYKNFTIIFITLLLMQSCSTVYYVGQTIRPTQIYNQKDTTSIILCSVPVGTQLLIKERYEKYYFVIYGNSCQGFLHSNSFEDYHEFNSDIDGDLYGYSTKDSRGKSRSTTVFDKSVDVKGYYKKDGTYVQPYRRRSPSKKY